MKSWVGSDGKYHEGILDPEDPFMSLRIDDYPSANQEVLWMVNFKKDKTQIYTDAQSLINQGLVIFPQDLNARGEIELQEYNSANELVIRCEKASYDEMNSLTQMSLLKEEITGMQKVKKPSGNIVFEQSVEAKQAGKHDDRVDCLAMLCGVLQKLRVEEALQVQETPQTAYKDMLSRMQEKNTSKKVNPFGNMGSNPFAGSNKINPF